MLWRRSNNNLLRANCGVLCTGKHSLLRTGNHGLLCTGANDGLLRGANDRVLSAAAGGGRYHTRRLCPRDLRDAASDLLCTCYVYHGLFPVVVIVSTIFRTGWYTK